MTPALVMRTGDGPERSRKHRSVRGVATTLALIAANLVAPQLGGASSGASSHSGVDPQTVLNMMREQCTDLSMKINTLDLDKTEHELVINALEPLPADRKCFRMIGNVVVERTVGEVLPAVQKNREQIKETMDKFTETLAAKQKEADEFGAKHRITAQGQTASAQPAASEEGGSQGVLI